MNITEESEDIFDYMISKAKFYEKMNKDSTVKVPHPKGDGTWVIFTGLTIRQKEVLSEYMKLAKQKERPLR